MKLLLSILMLLSLNNHFLGQDDYSYIQTGEILIRAKLVKRKYVESYVDTVLNKKLLEPSSTYEYKFKTDYITQIKNDTNIITYSKVIMSFSVSSPIYEDHWCSNDSLFLIKKGFRILYSNKDYSSCFLNVFIREGDLNSIYIIYNNSIYKLYNINTNIDNIPKYLIQEFLLSGIFVFPCPLNYDIFWNR